MFRGLVVGLSSRRPGIDPRFAGNLQKAAWRMNTTSDRRSLHCFRKKSTPPPPRSPPHTELLPTRCDTHPASADRIVNVDRIRPFCTLLNTVSLYQWRQQNHFLHWLTLFSRPALLIQLTIPKSRSFVTVPNHAQNGMPILIQNEIRNVILKTSNHRTPFI